MEATQELQVGDVTYFNERRGFGYLSDANDQSHYFHIKYVNHLENGARPIPRVGDLFHFFLRPSTSKQGADEAFNLHLVRRAQSPRPEAR
jgi:hypothetical protein